MHIYPAAFIPLFTLCLPRRSPTIFSKPCGWSPGDSDKGNPAPVLKLSPAWPLAITVVVGTIAAALRAGGWGSPEVVAPRPNGIAQMCAWGRGRDGGSSPLGNCRELEGMEDRDSQREMVWGSIMERSGRVRAGRTFSIPRGGLEAGSRVRLPGVFASVAMCIRKQSAEGMPGAGSLLSLCSPCHYSHLSPGPHPFVGCP